MLLSPDNKIFFAVDENHVCGFIHVSLRRDYVEGTDGSPVGYIEGIYVKVHYRKKGIALLLINEAANWCRQNNITELASDTELDNSTSQRFHEAVGFKEVNRIVCYVKKIG